MLPSAFRRFYTPEAYIHSQYFPIVPMPIFGHYYLYLELKLRVNWFRIHS